MESNKKGLKRYLTKVSGRKSHHEVLSSSDGYTLIPVSEAGCWLLTGAGALSWKYRNVKHFSASVEFSSCMYTVHVHLLLAQPRPVRFLLVPFLSNFKFPAYIYIRPDWLARRLVFFEILVNRSAK